MQEEVSESGGRMRLATWVALGALLTLGAAVRLWGIGWGLPDSTHLFSYHPDEYHSLRGALALATGDPNPHFFNYGSLYLYLVGLVCLWRDAVLGGADLVTALLRGTDPHWEMARWVLDARLVVVALGSATVAVAFAAGHRMGGPWAGAGAGAVMALLPLHVLHSHYATVDVPQAFFIALCLYQSLGILERPNCRNYVLAGLWAGLAASVKYNGVVGLVAPLVAHVLAQPDEPHTSVKVTLWPRNPAASEKSAPCVAPSRQLPNGGTPDGGARPIASWARVGLMLVAAALAFALTSPFVVLSWPEAWRDIHFELTHMRVGESPVREAYPNGWLFHAHGSLALTALALTVGGGSQRRRVLPVAAFALVWFAMIGAAGVRYARYEMPLEPVTAVLAGAGWTWAAGLRRERWWLGAWAVTGAAYLFLLAATVTYHCRVLSGENVRDVMLREVVVRVPAGEKLAVIWEPWFNVAPVDYCNGGEVLRRNPIFRRFHRPVLPRPAVVLGMDADRLLRERPYAVLVSDFELDPVFNRVSPSHQRMTQVLWGSGVYECAVRLERPRGLGEPASAWRASDNRYACPELTLFLRRR